MPGKQHRLVLPPVSPAAPGPLYQQIVEGVKREISAGRLAPGAPLPSFRELAESLLVSLITVKRAYAELEQEGIIFRKQGLGTFVCENGRARSRVIKREATENLLRRAIREGRDAGMLNLEIQHLLFEMLQEGDADNV